MNGFRYCTPTDCWTNFQRLFTDQNLKKLSRLNIQRFIRLIIPALEHIQLKTPVALSRDPKDNYLLSLSKDGKAKYLVTGDPDLLVIKQFGQTKIVKMAEFQQAVEP